MNPTPEQASPTSNLFRQRSEKPNSTNDGSEYGDGDTASQRSISLSSAGPSPRHSMAQTADKRVSKPYTLDTDMSSEVDDVSFGGGRYQLDDSFSPSTSAPASVYDEEAENKVNEIYSASTTYPPDRKSMASLSSQSSRKARPESLLVTLPEGQLVLGVALVDFNHVVGPTIEWSKGRIFEDEEVVKILPFLALPDGAHLSAEDYSYFHLVPSGPKPTTIFGISCNQQIATSSLLFKTAEMTRSTVQKAVVVLVSKPLFGPIRDKLAVVTTALFLQRDFRETSILDEFEASLEPSMRGQLTESGLYMGTNLRDLVHTFRQRTLVLVKALLLQKRILFYGHPVEKLCTFQYSLVTLLPGLLQTLDDAGSPPLANRAPTLTRPTSLKTSDRKSMMAFTGLPLDIFGKDAFFQPYLPLQQMDMLKESRSWLCGSTNSVVTQQKEVDLLINIETGILEFKDPNIERVLSLTPADRKWMDDLVQEVNEGWSDENPNMATSNINFKGSDDYLRSKFEEYVSAILSTIRYRDFIAKGEASGVLVTAGTTHAAEDFNLLWIQEFKKTNAYDVWERVTDPMLFDIIEPQHPCNEKPSVVTDIGLRLQEGLQDLKLEQQLAPAREAVSRTLTAGSAGFFKAVGGVRERWAQRSVPSTPGAPSSDPMTEPPVEVTRADLDSPSSSESPSRPPAAPAAQSWGSFWNKAPRFSVTAFAKPVSSPMSPPASAAEEKPAPSIWSRTSVSRTSDERTHHLTSSVDSTKLSRVSPSPPTSPPARTFSPPASPKSTSSAISQQPSFDLEDGSSVEFKSPLMAELHNKSTFSPGATPTVPQFDQDATGGPTEELDLQKSLSGKDAEEISLNSRNSFTSSVNPYAGMESEVEDVPLSPVDPTRLEDNDDTASKRNSVRASAAYAGFAI